jgi:hypothetical protein
MDIVVAYIRTRRGTWHKQLTVDGELMSNERCNLDDSYSAAWSPTPPPPGARLCKRCFKG